jgi:hypothetical protein
MKYHVNVYGEGSYPLKAASLSDAIEEAEDMIKDGDYGKLESTIWVDYGIVEYDDEGELDTVYDGTVALDPTEPTCADGYDHDWVSPLWLFGGVEENPGVFAHGGGVVIYEACRHCGTEKVIDSWAQRPDTGEQGLRSVEYTPGKHTDSFRERGTEWVRDHEWEDGEEVDLSGRGALFRQGAVEEFESLGFRLDLDANGCGVLQRNVCSTEEDQVMCDE